jgi:two-component system sensor histidine kinase HydH
VNPLNLRQSTHVTARPNAARLVRWGLFSAIVLLGIALLATVWASNRSVSAASDTLVRGQGELLREGIRRRLVQLRRAPTDPDVAELLADLSDQGLRAMVVLGRPEEVVARAGTMDPAPLRPPRGPDQRVGGRVRSWFIGGPPRHPHARPERARRPPPPDGPPPMAFAFVFEFEPVVATDVRATARRALIVGAVAAALLFAIAVALLRWLVRAERRAKVAEHARRLASLGEMSAVLAHEIRNPLASLKGHAQLLVESLEDDEKRRAKADRVVGEATRIEALTGDLLEFVRAGDIERGPADPGALLRACARSVPGEVEVDSDEAPTTWALDADRMRQVLTNLLDNAVQASPDAAVQASVRARDGRLEYRVRDRGDGISADDRERIFEPFFTRRTRGTGLGLAIARRLVEAHGGTISVANHAEGGAEFRVVIPGAARGH